MSFVSRYRGSELTIMVKLISIFGVVEACQMRELFSHLGDKQYSKIMSRLHQEGMLYTLPDAEHLASNRLSVNKVNWDDSVASFWALISIKDSIQDFCAGEMPAILTVSTGEFDCDIIPVNDKALALINDHPASNCQAMCAGFWLFDHSMPLRASSAGSEMILSSSWGKTA